MVLFRLHVWGPAFGLASIDAECLATITYLANALQAHQWELVATSPSGVPTHSLPALHEPGSGQWSSGFTSVVARLRDLGGDAWDLDSDLDVSQRADSTAYASFLRSAAAPLVALSLYVSSANWSAATRPAYSSVLPFPLTWTEPLSIRHHMCHVADHLGLSGLNVDNDHDASQAHASATSESTDGFLKVPERLRPRRRGVKAALSPEQTGLFRLEAVANDCLAVLADLKAANMGGDERSFFARPRDAPSALDCLAFGYLALMLVPDVPRPWLKDLIRRRYECLALFVDGMRDAVFGGDVASSLPWASSSPSGDSAAAAAGIDKQTPWTATRFVKEVATASVPQDWLLRDAPHDSAASMSASSILATLGSGAAVLGILGSALLYRHMPPLGSALYRWEMPRRPAFGAAGAFFGI